MYNRLLLAHLSQRLVGDLIVRPLLSSTISNMNISYQKHHWDGGKAALGFWARLDQNSGFHDNRWLP